jgi:hypothetical protein
MTVTDAVAMTVVVVAVAKMIVLMVMGAVTAKTVAMEVLAILE